MYVYDEFDSTFIAERAAEFREQVARRLSGELTEDEFKPLRLMNGVYLQLHAYMLRIAIPYGTLSSNQLRKLAHVARVYDRGYGHFTTRQNLQFNWIKLSRRAGRHRGAGRGRHSCDPDHRQLHPQRHHRSMGGRRARRDRGPAASGPRSCANGRRCTRNSPSCRASSRSRSRRAPHDRAAVKIHDIGLRMIANASRRGWLRGLGWRRAWALALHRQGDPRFPAQAGPAQLPRSGFAHLQCLRPPRQQSTRRA